MEGKYVDIVIISDSIGVTAETVLEAVSLQFPRETIREIYKHSFINTREDIKKILKKIKNPKEVIIFYTLVVPFVMEYLDEYCKDNDIVAVDLLNDGIEAVARLTGLSPFYKSGMDAKIGEKYRERIDAMEFAVKYDDGKDAKGIFLADLVLIGISRTSKTPLSMYLASKNIKVCNLPISPDTRLPHELYEVDSEKIVGLTIDSKSVANIRTERLSSLGLSDTNNYSNPDRIKNEIEYASKVFEELGCSVIDVSNKAIEQTAMIIQSIKGGFIYE